MSSGLVRVQHHMNGMYDEIYGVACKVTAATQYTLLCLIDKAGT